MRTRIPVASLGLIATAAALVAGLGTTPAAAAPVASSSPVASKQAGIPSSPSASARSSASGSFTSPCAYSHRRPDDPIVKPGQRGGSHDHDFFGNRSTDAFSTDASLRAAATTCARTGDTAAYWVPTLIHDGRPVAARQMRVYYRTGGLRDTRTMATLPQGLRIIAGDGKAVAAQPLSVASWACTVRGGGPEGDEKEVADLPRTCDDEPLRLKIIFPNCWNGTDLDSADHKRHMAYSARGRCPSSHPVGVPQVTMSLRYWIKGSLERVSLSSHGTYSAHADFFNTWHQATLDALVERCLRRGSSCGEAG